MFKIEEKSKVTAVCLKDNAVSVSDQKIQEPTVMAYVRPEQTEKNEEYIASGTGSGYPGRPLFLTARAIRGISTSERTMPGRDPCPCVGQDRVEVISRETDRAAQFLSEVRSAWRIS